MDPLRFRFRLLKSYGSCSDSGSEFLTSYGSDSGSTSQQVTVPTVPVLVPVPVPQHWCKVSKSENHLYRYSTDSSGYPVFMVLILGNLTKDLSILN